MYDFPQPHPKNFIETLYNIYPMYGFCVDFYIDILKLIIILGETIHNAFGNIICIYTALVSLGYL